MTRYLHTRLPLVQQRCLLPDPAGFLCVRGRKDNAPLQEESLRETPLTETGVNFARPPYVRSDNGETKSCNTFGSLLVQSEGHFIWMFFTSNREQFPIRPSAGSQAVNHCQ